MPTLLYYINIEKNEIKHQIRKTMELKKSIDYQFVRRLVKFLEEIYPRENYVNPNGLHELFFALQKFLGHFWMARCLSLGDYWYCICVPLLFLLDLQIFCYKRAKLAIEVPCFGE